MNVNKITFPASDSVAQDALNTGWITDALGEKKRVIARHAIETPSGIHIIFESETNIQKPKWVTLWAQTTRAFSLTATLTPCLAVLAHKLFTASDIHWPLALASMFGAVALQVAINILNDVEDYRRLIDLPETLGGSGVIQKGWWTALELKNIAFFLGLGVLLGTPALVAHFKTIIIVAVVGFLGVIRYSARTFGLKYWALGDLAVWIPCGPALTSGIAISATGSVDTTDLLIGSYFGWLAVAILHANNLQDMPIDKKRGVKTLALALGFKNSIRFLFLNYLLAAGSLLGAIRLTDITIPFLFPMFLTLGLAIPWLIQVAGSLGPDSAQLIGCRVRAAKIHLLSGIFLTLCLVGTWRLQQ